MAVIEHQRSGAVDNESGIDSTADLDIDICAGIGALDLDVHLSVAAGTLALVGPNGAGKSSTLLCALGIRRPREGRIVLGGRVLFEVPGRDRSRGLARGRIDIPTEERGFGYVPQHHALLPHLTAAGNLVFALACARHRLRPTLPRRGRRGHRREQAQAMLRALGVAHVADRLPAALSGGEAQRVALARALVAQPAALLLDEPFAALDARARPAMRDLLQRTLATLGRPAIIVTHDIGDAAALASRIAVMEQGRIVQVGTLAALQQQPATPFVAGLIGAGSGQSGVRRGARALVEQAADGQSLDQDREHHHTIGDGQDEAAGGPLGQR